jgi:hypothetical protein
MKKKNKLDAALEPLFERKEKLITDIEMSCKSIEFWEKRAEKIFNKIDLEEQESFLMSEESFKDSTLENSKEIQILMKRISLENDQLDAFDEEILNLEEEIVKTLSSYAKKQKK